MYFVIIYIYCYLFYLKACTSRVVLVQFGQALEVGFLLKFVIIFYVEIQEI